jgi:sirohydrochlorin cobaltochelatase
MRDSIEEIFTGFVTPFFIGEILVQKTDRAAFVLSHRDDESVDRLHTYRDAEAAPEIARYDDKGNYRPLKTAPNLRHGWRLELATVEELKRALNYFYPARLATFAAWKSSHLETTPLRETLNRQSGMYRVAAKISDPQINALVADFCRSDTGCLRTILWRRDRQGTIASTKLPREKFDPLYDQVAAACSRPVGDARSSHSEAATVPLLCQEPCNLLIAACRKVVKDQNADL